MTSLNPNDPLNLQTEVHQKQTFNNQGQTNMRNQLITAAFFMEGLRDLKGHSYDDLVTCWGQGCIEMVDALVGYVPLTNLLSEAAAASQDGNWPGVFDYEVSGSFGRWFAEYIMEHGDQPPQKEAHQFLIQEIGTFFSQCCTPEEAEAVKQVIQTTYEGAQQ